jgi:PIN domain nuclease of toxin-antitoxin system
VRLLLDTDVLLWTLAGHQRVEHLRERIVDDTNEVYFSAASLWELELRDDLAGLGSSSLRAAARESGFKELPVLGAHVAELERTIDHANEFKRMLLAQANAEPMRLLTADSSLAKFGVNLEVI